ncbi:cytochrome P450 6j1-like isoform X2 [Cimex lectularius]|nr:cytochrome P450 6j1-like isoform X2 [Cimex lectularius]
MLIVKDLDLIKDVLVKDFNVFADNGFVTYESVDALIGLNSFTLRGAAWKPNRAVQSPAHRISKIKLMVPLMAKTAQNFVEFVSQQTEEICVNVVSRFYTIDTVASCAFGVNNDSFFDKNSQFLKNTLGQLFSDSNAGALSAFFAPWFSLIFRTRIIQKRAEDFFLYLADELLSQRKRSTTPGNDLVQHLLFLQEKSAKEGTPLLKPIEIAAQLMTFYLDGTETASIALSFILFEIAAHEDIQKQLRDEIMSAGESLEEFNFEKLWSLEYLNMVITESLRAHPPIPLLSRICLEDYTMNGVKIEKGTKVFIPVFAIHNDPDIYPCPYQFKPERFSKVNRASQNNYSYLPFGEGPRICVGFKFALTEIKMAVVALLLNFKLTLSSRHSTKRIIPDDRSSFVYTSKDDLYIRFHKYNK